MRDMSGVEFRFGSDLGKGPKKIVKVWSLTNEGGEVNRNQTLIIK